MRDYVAMARAHWLGLSAFAVVGVLLAALASLLTTPQYTARAEMVVVADTGSATDLVQGSEYTQKQVRTFSALATRQVVVQPAMAELGLTGSTGAVVERLSATSVLGTNVISVTATDPSPQAAADLAGQGWPIVSPFIGALGAFVAGSNTVSNMMFALFQFNTGLGIGAASPETVAALQAVGGAAGNMVAVHNVVAAAATVGLLGREGDLIRKTILPMTYYCLTAGAVGYLWIYGFAFNAGLVVALLVVAALVATAVWMLRKDDAYNPEVVPARV